MRKIKEPSHRVQNTLGTKRRNRRHTGMLHWQEYKIQLKKMQALTVADVLELVNAENEEVVIHTPGMVTFEGEEFGGKDIFEHFEDADKAEQI